MPIGTIESINPLNYKLMYGRADGMPSSLSLWSYVIITCLWKDIYHITLLSRVDIACFTCGYLLLDREPSRLRETQPPRGGIYFNLELRLASLSLSVVAGPQSPEMASLIRRHLRALFIILLCSSSFPRGRSATLVYGPQPECEPSSLSGSASFDSCSGTTKKLGERGSWITIFVDRLPTYGC